MKKIFSVYILLILSAGCTHKAEPTYDDATVWDKIKLNFKRLDTEGLAGPDGGKVSVHYEFCIPAQTKFWRKVHRIDKTAVKLERSKGRAACSDKQWLVIGSTRQPEYRRVLYDLARLPEVTVIKEVFWE